jgi:hypothetical protein
MRTTPFPATPSDVVALTVPEFAGAADWTASVSIDVVCQRFLDDANRALVWFIRFQALTAWCQGRDAAVWLRSDLSHLRRARDVAASFELNGKWEFDAESFRAAVESVAG